MKKSRYTDAQIIAILRQAESGVSVVELCREHGMSDASFYSRIDSRAGLYGPNRRRPNWDMRL